MKKLLIIAILTTFSIFALVSVTSHADADRLSPIAGIGEEPAEPLGNRFAHDKKPTVGTMAKCPVMVGTFKVKDDTPFSKYKGKWYAFCCSDCKSKFDADPEKYLQACPEDCPCED